MMINEQLYNDSSSVSRPLIQVINEIILIFKYAPWILKFNMEAQKQGVEAWNMIFLLDSNPMWKAHNQTNNQQQQPTTTTTPAAAAATATTTTTITTATTTTTSHSLHTRYFQQGTLTHE